MKKENSELRRDPVSGDWIVVAYRRAFRPQQLKPSLQERAPESDCPFEDPQKDGHKDPLLLVDCKGQISSGKASRYALEKRDWFLQIIPNKFPIVSGAKCGIEKRSGVFVWQIGAGFHEVVIFGNHDRDPSQFSKRELLWTIRAYQERYRELASENCAQFILIFHNHGPAAGASIYHPHSQIIALPVIPPDVGRSIAGSREYHRSNKKCVHCEMIEGERLAKSRVVYENEEMIVLCPFASRVSFEMRVLPKKHEYAFEHISERQRECLADALGTALRKMVGVLKSPSYNFFIHTAPTQPEHFSHYHWHLEILPRISIWAGVELGTGIEVVTVPPEEAARHLREAEIIPLEQVDANE